MKGPVDVLDIMLPNDDRRVTEFGEDKSAAAHQERNRVSHSIVRGAQFRGGVKWSERSRDDALIDRTFTELRAAQPTHWKHEHIRYAIDGTRETRRVVKLSCAAGMAECCERAQVMKCKVGHGVVALIDGLGTGRAQAREASEGR